MAFEKRKSHIKRIYKDNDQNSSVWVDIERVDNFSVDTVHQDNAGGQGIDYSFDWDSFDPNDPNNDVLTIVQGDDPQQQDGSSDSSGSSDSTPKIKIPLRNYINVQISGRLYYIYFDNTENNQVRKVHTKTIYNRDISKDHLDQDGQPPRDAEEYFNLIQSIDPDKSQSIDVEVIDKYVLDQDRKQTFSEKNWVQNIDAIISEAL
jgi:hypothetical protein